MGASIILDIILVFILTFFVFLVRYILKIRKILKMYKDNPNIQGIAIVNGKIQIIEKEQVIQKPAPKEIFLDPVCGKQIERKDAYSIIRQGKEYLFCSWECRERFLKNEKGDNLQEGNI